MKFKINPALIEKISNELLIVISLEDKNVHCSNETGILIWESIKEGKDKDQILKRLTSEYAIDENTARIDLEEFLDKLVSNNLIVQI